MVEILHGLAGGAFPKIVGQETMTRRRAELSSANTDIGKNWCVATCCNSGNEPAARRGPWTAGVEPAIKRLDVSRRFAARESDVDSGKNATGEGSRWVEK